MSDGLNRVTLFGNLGADPELRVTPGGQAVLKLRMATSETYLDKSNTKQERTEWHSITIWGKRGEALAKYLEKGSKLLVEGSIRTSTYEKDGEKRYRTEIVANNVVFGGGGGRRQGDDDDEEEEAPAPRAPAPQSGGQRYGGASGYGANAKHTGTPDNSRPDDFQGSFGGGDDEIPF